MKFTSDPLGDIGHHGGIELCDSDTANNRRARAELLWIGRHFDYGYTTHGTGIGHHYKYVTDPVSTGSTGMHNNEYHTWRIILDNKGIVQMWSVDGVDLTKYHGMSTGCATNTEVYPKIWSYGASMIVDRVMQIAQMSDIEPLKHKFKKSMTSFDDYWSLSAVPYHTEVNECERQADGSLRVNSVGTGKTQNACSIQGRGSHSGCFARLPNISD